MFSEEISLHNKTHSAMIGDCRKTDGIGDIYIYNFCIFNVPFNKHIIVSSLKGLFKL